jgi:hypothetical protein
LIEREVGGLTDVATPSGLSGFATTGSWSRFEAAWREFVHGRGYVCGYIGLHPLFAPDALDAAPRHNSVYMLDLSVGREELLRRMDRNRRRQLRSWDQRRDEFVVAPDEVAAFLETAYAPFMRDAGAPPPHLSVEALELICRSESALAVGTRSRHGLDAAYVFGTTAYGGECLINVATGSGRSRATDLVWYGVAELAERGVPVLNLGGGGSEDDEIARAKQRFGPSRLALRSVREIYDVDAYRELCALAGVDPGSNAGFFPAYRSRRSTAKDG